MKNVYKPVFYRPDSDADTSAFYTLFNSPTCSKHDTIRTQIVELLACRNPSLQKQEILDQNMVEDHLAKNKQSIENYGVWVHYPWKNQLVHILDEEEFIEVRTNRNKYKITQEEQDLLRTKKVGIIGLSVGRAVATTIALERIAGEIRLADFDRIELSNLNRIQAPLTELGLNKTITTAREIAELDPFINVKCYDQGLSESNIHDFLLTNEKLDLLIEECDDLKLKVFSRIVCRELSIPVVMELNDNCIVDIERFDLEAERPIFHGLVDESLEFKDYNNLDIEEKTQIILKIFPSEVLSARTLESFKEVNKSIVSWAQLGSEVIYGGALLVRISKMIFLGEYNNSGRFSFDVFNSILQQTKYTSDGK